MKNRLNTESNIADYDEVYQHIIEMHQSLSEEESQSANAKLILTLANHVGDIDIIKEAIDIVRANTIEWREKG